MNEETEKQGGEAMKKKCEKCFFYHKSNNTCQSKKCATGGDGKITLFDRLFCEPFTKESETQKGK